MNNTVNIVIYSLILIRFHQEKYIFGDWVKHLSWLVVTLVFKIIKFSNINTQSWNERLYEDVISDLIFAVVNYQIPYSLASLPVKKQWHHNNIFCFMVIKEASLWYMLYFVKFFFLSIKNHFIAITYRMLMAKFDVTQPWNRFELVFIFNEIENISLNSSVNRFMFVFSSFHSVI